MNHRTKFDAASSIVGGEIRNRTNRQTDKETVNDISTPCLSACVDNKTVERLCERSQIQRLRMLVSRQHGPCKMYDCQLM